ncbi:MAG: hypothetical protein HQL23_01545 [Candidatus Omnitrophica bacterium]|nr:hypothetical protein [Candidatus Omnitrophota bacterium]
MREPRFSMEEAIRFGWDSVKANKAYFIWMILLAWLVPLVPQLLSSYFDKKQLFAFLFFYLLAVVLSSLIAAGLTKIYLGFCDFIKLKYATLFQHWRLAWKLFVAGLLCGLVVVFGLLLLIVPGIIFAIRLQFFGYLIVDKDLGIIAALNKSFAITRGSTFNLLLFGAVYCGILMLGILCLFVGLLIAIPTVGIASAHVYRQLMKREEGAVPSGVS